MGDPVFGITFRRIDDEPMPVIGADLSTIGLIGPIDEANPQFYALNIPSKVYSNDTNMLSYLGATGYIPDAFDGINAQLGEFQSAAKVVVVRTLGGTNADAALRTQESIAHVMGSSLDQTGIWAFLKAPSLLACTARLICAPGYTGQMANSLGELHIGTIGHGYVPGQSYPITFTGGGSSETIVLPTAHAIADVNGDINQFELAIDTFGAWFSEAPLATIPAPEVAVRAIGTSALGADTQAGTVTSLLIGTPGSGYIPGQTYAVVFTGGTPDTPATAHAVPNSLGIIGEEEVYLDGGGTGYETPPTYAVAVPPTAVRATLTTELSTGANPVCTMLPAILEQTIAHAVVESAGTSEILDEDWRETMQSQRLIGVCGGVKVMDPTTGNIIARPIAPRVAGIIVRRDHETGAPFHSAANQPVQGIVGPLRDIAFSITDDANEGQQLLRNNLGILVRGETGSDFAIASGGFVFIGTDNLGESELWRMYNVMRGRDFIHLSLLKALRIFLGRYNITGHTIQAILNTMGFFLRDLQALEHILGYKVSFKGSLNSAEEIRLGHLTVGFAAEEAPVLKKLTVMSARYRPAIDMMVQSVERQLNLAA